MRDGATPTDFEAWAPNHNLPSTEQVMVEVNVRPPPSNPAEHAEGLTHADQFFREWYKHETLSGAFQTQDCH
eukprot:12776877-Prorocentrum_lima.AAC.1